MEQEYFVTSGYIENVNENSYDEDDSYDDEDDFSGKGRDCKAYCKSQGFTRFKGLGKCKRECKRAGGVDSVSSGGSGSNVKIADLVPPTETEKPKSNYLLWGGLAFVIIIIVVVVIVVIKRKK